MLKRDNKNTKRMNTKHIWNKESISISNTVNHITNVLFSFVFSSFFLSFIFIFIFHLFWANNRVVKQFGYVVVIIIIILTRHSVFLLHSFILHHLMSPTTKMKRERARRSKKKSSFSASLAKETLHARRNRTRKSPKEKKTEYRENDYWWRRNEKKTQSANCVVDREHEHCIYMYDIHNCGIVFINHSGDRIAIIFRWYWYFDSYFHPIFFCYSNILLMHQLISLIVEKEKKTHLKIRKWAFPLWLQ